MLYGLVLFLDQRIHPQPLVNRKGVPELRQRALGNAHLQQDVPDVVVGRRHANLVTHRLTQR